MDITRIQAAIEKLSRRDLQHLSGIVHSAQYKFAIIDMAHHPAPIVGDRKLFDSIVDIIKRYRSETNLGLLESKHAVELAVSICDEIGIGYSSGNSDGYVCILCDQNIPHGNCARQ